MKDLSPLEIAKFWMLVKEDKTTKLKYSHNKCLGHCWIWQGSFFSNGYGRMGINRKTYRAHRISYYLVHGEISSKNLICHKCDNPACVNPEHLFPGTSKDNVQDMIDKGRKVIKGRDGMRPVRKKLTKTSSCYYGVYYRKDNKKWRVRYTLNYNHIYIGQYETELEAACAFDKAISEVNVSLPDKDKFILNFPN